MSQLQTALKIEETEWADLAKQPPKPNEWLQVLAIDAREPVREPTNTDYTRFLAMLEPQSHWRRLMAVNGMRYIDPSVYRVDYWRVPPW